MQEPKVAMVDNNLVMAVDHTEDNNNVVDMAAVTKAVNKQGMVWDPKVVDMVNNNKVTLMEQVQVQAALMVELVVQTNLTLALLETLGI